MASDQNTSQARVAGVSAASELLQMRTSNPHHGRSGAYLATEHFNEGYNACVADAQSRIASLTADLAEARALAERNSKEGHHWADIYENQAKATRAELDALKAAATAPRVPLTDERIDELNREAQDQGISGIAPSRYLARSIEAAHGISAIPGDDSKAVGGEAQS